ncbi:hypothetical protein [Endozoicomonas montiporae]|uniref:Uncharacterized protein n=1 Tax=Endozoicomonas montiporae CL-33 TaxID=570277 RepID=A0A142BA36_9GAMM|nr:hypothetical protein [Endozoicomonas montiporae]AMO55612.1 hypothetical protein EZMO1_1441 [Endozoicomonas montiporae CL-33]
MNHKEFDTELLKELKTLKSMWAKTLDKVEATAKKTEKSKQLDC